MPHAQPYNARRDATASNPAPRGYGWALLIPAAVLAGAALLKAWAYHHYAGARGIEPLLLIGYEVVLAGWLSSQWKPAWAKHAAVVTFVVFAAYSTHLIAIGQENCGCFGSLTVSPVATLILDIAMIAILLGFYRPAVPKPHTNRGWPSHAAKLGALGLAGTTAALILTAVQAREEAPDPSHQTRDIASIALQPKMTYDLGYVPAGTKVSRQVMLISPANQNDTIEAISSECKCLTAEIEAAGDPPRNADKTLITVGFDPTGLKGAYRKSLTITTRDNQTRQLDVTARIALPLRWELKAYGQGKRSVVVYNDGGRPIKLLYAIAANEGPTVKTPKEAIPSMSSIELAVVPDAAEGNSITIRTDDADQPELVVLLPDTLAVTQPSGASDEPAAGP